MMKSDSICLDPGTGMAAIEDVGTRNGLRMVQSWNCRRRSLEWVIDVLHKLDIHTTTTWRLNSEMAKSWWLRGTQAKAAASRYETQSKQVGLVVLESSLGRDSILFCGLTNNVTGLWMGFQHPKLIMMPRWRCHYFRIRFSKHSI